MKLADIPRVRAGQVVGAIKALDALEKERLTLGTRAADLLGYRGLVANVWDEPGFEGRLRR